MLHDSNYQGLSKPMTRNELILQPHFSCDLKCYKVIGVIRKCYHFGPKSSLPPKIWVV